MFAFLIINVNFTFTDHLRSIDLTLLQSLNQKDLQYLGIKKSYFNPVNNRLCNQFINPPVQNGEWPF